LDLTSVQVTAGTVLLRTPASPANSCACSFGAGWSWQYSFAFTNLVLDGMHISVPAPWFLEISRGGFELGCQGAFSSGIPCLQSLSGSDWSYAVGPSWEGFVIENCLAAAPSRAAPSFYRTAAGAEIDLVLDIPGRGRWAIEIKHGLEPRLGKGFHVACDDIAPKRRFVVHSGEERFPIDADTEAVSVRQIAKLLGEAKTRL
jgi:hypothetical protein